MPDLNQIAADALADIGGDSTATLSTVRRNLTGYTVEDNSSMMGGWT